MRAEENKKPNRVRLGGGGPYVAQSTFDEIKRRKLKWKISTGRVVDLAVHHTKSDK